MEKLSWYPTSYTTDGIGMYGLSRSDELTDSEVFLIWPISFIIEVKSASNLYV